MVRHTPDATKVYKIHSDELNRTFIEGKDWDYRNQIRCIEEDCICNVHLIIGLLKRRNYGDFKYQTKLFCAIDAVLLQMGEICTHKNQRFNYGNYTPTETISFSDIRRCT